MDLIQFYASCIDADIEEAPGILRLYPASPTSPNVVLYLDFDAGDAEMGAAAKIDARGGDRKAAMPKLGAFFVRYLIAAAFADALPHDRPFSQRDVAVVRDVIADYEGDLETIATDDAAMRAVQDDARAAAKETIIE